MLYRVRARHFLGTLAAAVLAGGCSGGTSPVSLGLAPEPHFNHQTSWMLPDAKDQSLLYVSDNLSATVDAYDYRSKTGKLFGQLTGFADPSGLCIDGLGNVYVTDGSSQLIYEFAHGGAKPIAKVFDTFGYPTGCSVSPKNGDVAISNYNTYTSGGGNFPGGVVIASGGLSGKQVNYSGSALFNAFPPGYDPSGNLFVQAVEYSGDKSFQELPAGEKAFKPLNGLSITSPAGVVWDGKYVTATDRNYRSKHTTMIYRITVSGATVTILRKTELTDTCYTPHNWMVAMQPFVSSVGDVVVAGNEYCLNRENYFSYAKGGNPTRSIDPAIAPKSPVGQVVSPP